jgi:prepilin-type N-terminal cleavage/methylation domain-containing protein
MKKFYDGDEGFTLVELMVVVLIIGIHVAIAIPVFNAARTRAQQRQCFANERTVEGAVETYLTSTDTTGGVPTSPTNAQIFAGGVGSIIPDYIKSVPACNAGGVYTWWPGAKQLWCGAGTGFAGHGAFDGAAQASS